MMVLSFIDVLGAASLALFATAAGSALAVILGKKRGVRHPGLLALSAGIMAFSAMEMLNSAHKTMGDFGAFAFFTSGILLLFISEKSIPHVHRWIKKSDLEPKRKKAALIAGTLTIHNVPEGFAIAAAFAGSTPLGWMVSTSIALQDAPEGFMVTAPLQHYGMNKLRALWYGLFSGIVEFAAALVGYLFLSAATWLSPFALAISSGAMVYLVLVEIMPDAMANGKERIAGIWFIAGVAIAFGLAALLGF